MGELHVLTSREREVLELLARGWSNRGVAEALGLPVTTVRGHVMRMLAKLGVRSKLHAVALAAG